MVLALLCVAASQSVAGQSFNHQGSNLGNLPVASSALLRAPTTAATWSARRPQRTDSKNTPFFIRKRSDGRPWYPGTLSEALGIKNLGQVVGSSTSTDALSHAILWTPTHLAKQMERSRRNEATDSIVFAVASNFLSAFSAQKSRVKPPNHLTHYTATTSAWHVSFT
jgi:probable HAF family extracellular repeat protein